MTRSALADGEKRKQDRAELEADDTMQTLTEEERQERIAFLALPHTFSLEEMQALTEGIAHILGKVQAKPRPWPEQEREQDQAGCSTQRGQERPFDAS